MILLIVASSAFAMSAFASSDTHPAAISGEGVSAISGYNVTNISYQSGSDPSRIDSVSFTLNTTANFVKIRLIASQPKWYDCNSINGNDWICDTTGASLKSADQLTVVASNK